MRIVVMSDSHRLFGPLQRIVEAQPEAEFFIHLGDGESECEMLRREYPDKKFFFLRGNCDSSTALPEFLVIPVDEKNRIFASHGHKYSVKYTTSVIADAARLNGCNIALFGHTHERCSTYENGIHIMNPGSCSCPRDCMPPSYGFLDIVDNGVFKNIVSL